jgi:hypothetical protein
MRAAAQASFKTAEEAVTKALAELPKDTRNARQEYNGSDAKVGEALSSACLRSKVQR